jgi:hypothetical protein
LLIGQSPLAHHGDSLVELPRRHEFRYKHNIQMFWALHLFFFFFGAAPSLLLPTPT